MNVIKSDPFCNHYKELYKTTDIEHDDANHDVLNQIYHNILVINSANSVDNLSFDSDGTIVQSVKDEKKVSNETKKQDLIEFTRFAKWYLGNVHLSEKESREIREQLDTTLIHLRDIKGLLGYGTISIEANLHKASENSLLNEKLDGSSQTKNSPGKEIINARIAKLQPIAKQAAEDAKMARRGLGVSAAGGGIFLLSGMFSWLAPVFFALLAIGGLTAMAGLSIWSVFSYRNEIHKADIAELKQLDQLRKHYDEPGFKEFQKSLDDLNPDEKTIFLADLQNVKDFHTLYEKQQQLHSLSLEKKDEAKASALQKEIDALGKKLFEKTKVPPFVSLDDNKETPPPQVPLE